MRIAQRLIALAAIVVVGWIGVTSWSAVLHGHPLYAGLLAVTAVAAVAILWWSFRERSAARGWRLALGVGLAILAVAWIAMLAWLRPFTALEPALTAMESTGTVKVLETPTSITLLPGLDMSATGVFFQPGARVDARAYAAILRPLADAGYTVVIAKQPLGIGFLAMGAFDAAREANPDVTAWVVGGHSLGGTVAAMDAEEHDTDAVAPVSGLLLYASYPASDMSTSLTSGVLSISGAEDGLATPADIEASRADLPAEAQFTMVDGGVHAFFGDYGTQPGDGTPTITQDSARSQIAKASLDFVNAQAAG